MVNTLLMGVLTVVVTLSEGDILPVLLMYGGAAGVFALILAFNIRPILELLKNAKGLLRGR